MIGNKTNLIALNETHLRGSYTCKCCDNFTLAHSGLEENAKRLEKGVGFLFDSSVKLVKFTAHSPRNAVGWFEVCGKKLKFVSTCADEKENLKYLVELSMKLTAKVDCKDNCSIIVLGNVDAALGRETRATMPRTVGSFTIADETTRNGMLLK